MGNPVNSHRITFAPRPARVIPAFARSLSTKHRFGCSAERSDFALKLAERVTGKQRAVLVFSADEPEELLARFVALGGDCRFLQCLPATGDLANLLGWLRLWKPKLLILASDHDVHLFTSIEPIDVAPALRLPHESAHATATVRLTGFCNAAHAMSRRVALLRMIDRGVDSKAGGKPWTK
jgi:hypothetical protein